MSGIAHSPAQDVHEYSDINGGKLDAGTESRRMTRIGWLDKVQEWGLGLGEQQRLNEWQRLKDEHRRGTLQTET